MGLAIGITAVSFIIHQNSCDYQNNLIRYQQVSTLGVGICQRKDGLYTARFTSKTGKRKQKYFHKLQECRKWISDAQFEDEHGGIEALGEMSVSSWFDYWIENFKTGNVKTRTLQNYKDRYRFNIAPLIGTMLLSDVKPMHCQNVLNQMAGLGYCSSTIELTRATMSTLFDSAVENQLIVKTPVSKIVKCYNGKKPKQGRVLTKEEQRIFLKTAKGRSNYNQYALVLQTGLRAGELAGLKWSDIDFDKRILSVTRTIDYRSNEVDWEIKSPKSKAGIRDIPLTEEAVRILKEQKKKMRSADVLSIKYHEFVFLSPNGNLIRNSTYNKSLESICRKAGIECFSMHTLRHTFATRCAESGMNPKTLQSILGHSNISVTMDIYVHCTYDQKIKEFRNIENSLCVV